MKTLNLIHGSDDWHKIRGKFRPASEAPAMMGASKYVKRQELIHQKATGEKREVDAWTQKIFDRGHEIEAATLPIAEALIGAELFPVTCVSDDEYLLATMDGLTMDGRIGWECKSWNKDKLADVKAGRCPETDYWQIVQQLAVTGAEKILYMLSDGEKTESLWIEPNDQDILRLREGWLQFDQDVAAYAPPEDRSDVEWINAAYDYLAAKKAADSASEALEQAKARLLQLASGPVTRGAGVSVRHQTRSGSVDWKKVQQDFDIPVNQYRKPGTDYYVVEVQKNEQD